MKGYDEAIGDCPSHPEPAVTHRRIDLFLLERALYEIAYESVHRPGCIGIPLGGLARVLGAAS